MPKGLNSGLSWGSRLSIWPCTALPLFPGFQSHPVFWPLLLGVITQRSICCQSLIPTWLSQEAAKTVCPNSTAACLLRAPKPAPRPFSQSWAFSKGFWCP